MLQFKLQTPEKERIFISEKGFYILSHWNLLVCYFALVLTESLALLTSTLRTKPFLSTFVEKAKRRKI